MAKKPLKSDEILAKTEAMTERRVERIQQVVSQRQRDVMVIMEDVHNPHNLAAIARSCDAFGVQNLAFTLQNEDLFNPKDTGKVTSASASKWLDYRIFETGTHTALTTLKAEGWHIVATVAGEESVSIYEVDFTLPRYEKLAILVGNEHAGLSEVAIALADTRLTIPMLGMIRSFNVSVATAIILFEVTRQRHHSPQDFHLDEEAAQLLYEDFIRRGS